MNGRAWAAIGFILCGLLSSCDPTTHNGHGDPLGEVVLDSPANGHVADGGSLELRGHGESGISCCGVAQVALVRLGGRCSWWNEERLVAGDCNRPKWIDVHNFGGDGSFETGEKWTYEMEHLPTGRYQMMIRDWPETGVGKIDYPAITLTVR